MSKKLYKIDGPDTILGGVCLGLSKYLNVDIVIIRAVFVILFFTPVPILILYVILWALLPSYSESLSYAGNTNFDYKENQMKDKNKNDNFVGGVILIIVGTIFAFKTLFGIHIFSYIGKLWPLIPIGIGVWLLTKDKIQQNHHNHNAKLPEDHDSDSSEITKY